MIRTYRETFNGLKSWGVVGSYFRLLGTVSAVDVALLKSGNEVASLSAVSAGMYVELPQGRVFDEVRITTGASEQVQWVYADGKAGYDRLAGSVSLSAAIPQGATLTNVAEATVGVAASVVAAASATRLGLRFLAPATNSGNVALIGAGGTFANAAIILAPGDAWVESEAAAAAWSAIADAAAQKLRVLEVS